LPNNVITLALNRLRIGQVVSVGRLFKIRGRILGEKGVFVVRVRDYNIIEFHTPRPALAS
jgi:hypothetical protein